MKISKALCSTAGLLLSSFALAAPPVAVEQASGSLMDSNQVLVTQATDKNKGNRYGLDFVSDGNAIAFEFTLAFPKGTRLGSMDISKCVSQLPSSHTGKCMINENTSELLVLVYSMSNAKLPAGVVTVGDVGLGAGSKASPSVVKAIAVDDQIREYSIAGQLN
jgi:hypothetical protein